MVCVRLAKGFQQHKLCATLNLPRLSKSAYITHENKLLKAVSEVAEDSTKKAADDLALIKQHYNNQTLKCGVSVDGTWQRRG